MRAREPERGALPGGTSLTDGGLDHRSAELEEQDHNEGAQADEGDSPDFTCTGGDANQENEGATDSVIWRRGDNGMDFVDLSQSFRMKFRSLQLVDTNEN